MYLITESGRRQTPDPSMAPCSIWDWYSIFSRWRFAWTGPNSCPRDRPEEPCCVPWLKWGVEKHDNQISGQNWLTSEGSDSAVLTNGRITKALAVYASCRHHTIQSIDPIMTILSMFFVLELNHPFTQGKMATSLTSRFLIRCLIAKHMVLIYIYGKIVGTEIAWQAWRYTVSSGAVLYIWQNGVEHHKVS